MAGQEGTTFGIIASIRGIAQNDLVYQSLCFHAMACPYTLATGLFPGFPWFFLVRGFPPEDGDAFETQIPRPPVSTRRFSRFLRGHGWHPLLDGRSQPIICLSGEGPNPRL